MCGIAGILDRGGRPVDRAALDAMTAAMRHRGPDDHGAFRSHDRRGASVGMANTRLAIIDVEGGHQPMTSADGRYTIVYNGELYNAPDVSRELQSKGISLRTSCDTELVLAAYAAWGQDAVHHLDGMWAFAVWDDDERSLHLSRDRLGLKPLLYAMAGDRLVFGSEVATLLASGLVSPRLNRDMLPFFLSSFTTPDPMTALEGIERLPAGHCLDASTAGIRTYAYWDCADVVEDHTRSTDEWAEEIGALVSSSVRRQLVSDVPLGVFLSAGVDSTVVAAAAAQHSSAPLRTFTLGFDGADIDERSGAATIAARLGSNHVAESMDSRQAAAVLPDLLAWHGEPTQSLVQSYFVSRVAARSVKVALSGVGGDELFGSYPTHRAVHLLARLDAAAVPRRDLLLRLAARAPNARVRHLAELAPMEPGDRVATRLMHQISRADRARLLSADMRRTVDIDAPTAHLRRLWDEPEHLGPLNRILYVFLKSYLSDELLRTLDTMSMASSLEVRAPLLDHTLVETALTIPAEHKITMGSSKVVLRRLLDHWLPGARIGRRKQGFSLPVDHWMREELGELMRDVVDTRSLAERAVFDVRHASDVVDRFISGRGGSIQQAMMLLSFELWARGVLDRTVAPEHESGTTVTTVTTAAAPDPTSGPPGIAVSVVVVNWNTVGALRTCLQSVYRELAGLPFEVIVVDNASRDGSQDMVEAEFPQVRLIRNAANVGFGRANNQAMRVARGRYFLLLNSDALLPDRSVAELLGRLDEQTDVGIAHCRLTFPDGRLQHSTYRFPSLRLVLLEDFGLYKLLPEERRSILLAGYWGQHEERDVDWVSGAFMLLRREVFEQTGGFSDEIFMYGEDLEWCYRVRDAGWRIRFYPQATVVHLDHTSSTQRWGDEHRIELCLIRQQEIYERRAGTARGAAFAWLRAAGSVARLAYIAARSAAGPRSRAYRDMKPYAVLVTRILLRLPTRRRDLQLLRRQPA